jgi:small GTP-binding protein
MEKQLEYLFKVIVVGQIGCGKTSLIRRFCHNTFDPAYKSTIGVDFMLKVMKDVTDDGNQRITRIQLWDIAGQERYGNMTRVYYKQAVAALILVDLTRMDETLKSAKDWKDDIDLKVSVDGGPIPTLIVANKVDLIPEDRLPEISKRLEMFAKDLKTNGYFIVSAKTNQNIEAAFKFLLSEMFKIKSIVLACVETPLTVTNDGTIVVKRQTEPVSECIC